jgi:hypothetical protein
VILGNEATPLENQDGDSSKAELVAESGQIVKPNENTADATFTLHEGCIPAGDDLGKEVMMVGEAKRKASELPGCKGFCFPGVDEGRPVEVFFKSSWKLVKVDKPWTAFKLETSDTTLESKSPGNAQQTDAEKPKGTADSDLPAETASIALQSVSQTIEASQGTRAPAAPPADEEAVSPEQESQRQAFEERKGREELKAEKPAEKSKRFERQMCC